MFARITVLMIACLAMGFAGDEPQTKIKRVGVSQTSPASGKDMFNAYCATCHGTDARGGGPAAAALKVVPPDLTLMAKKNSGNYPAAHVGSILRSVDQPAHGSAEMPVWGPLFSSLSRGDQAIVQQRVSNLVDYLGSLQSK